MSLPIFLRSVLIHGLTCESGISTKIRCLGDSEPYSFIFTFIFNSSGVAGARSYQGLFRNNKTLLRVVMGEILAPFTGGTSQL